MWIHTQDGFLSIIRTEKGSGTLTVRARSKADLERFLKQAETHAFVDEPVQLKGRDYPWRAEVPAWVVGEVLADAVNAIDYPNFKDRVKQRLGEFRAETLSWVWGTLLRIEGEPDAEPVFRYTEGAWD